ncbi:hypothetical protein CGRA01v4_08156 [Colletotrichum graminicola]|nr:hypothetical protein CGRA01v4_08156 [Colletotrichum graminicola]
MALHLISQCWPPLWSVLATLAMAAQVIMAQECNYVGGWSLRYPASSCPRDAPFECGKAGDLQMRCCPTGLSCAGDGSYVGNYCCPDSTDLRECQDLVFEYPKCPVSSWNLWAANETVNNEPHTGAWCCEPGSIGIYRNNGTVNYFCTTTTVTTLQTNFYWAMSMTTASCSATIPTLVSSTKNHGASAPPSTTSSDSKNDAESSGASSGVIAGATVGGVAIVALIAAGLILYLTRKNKLKAEGVQAGGSKTRHVNELEVMEPRFEMDGTDPPYELDATTENIQEEGYSPTSKRPV